jgi:flagellar basal-body rod protein FlgB
MNKIGKKMPAENIKMLENYLSYCATKNKVINKNIANVGTKDYKREDVAFKDLLQDNINSSLKVTNEKHFGVSGSGSTSDDFEIVEDKGTDMASGVNNVDIDNEMAEMAENSIKFKFAAKKIGNFYRDIQAVIKNKGSV